MFEGQVEKEFIFSQETIDHNDDEPITDGQEPPPESTILNTGTVFFWLLVGTYKWDVEILSYC